MKNKRTTIKYKINTRSINSYQNPSNMEEPTKAAVEPTKLMTIDEAPFLGGDDS